MANRYWVGGAGTWDTVNILNWSATSGGAGGATAPTILDNVFINSASGVGVISLGADITCLSLDARTYTGTLNFSNFVINLAVNNAPPLRFDSGATTLGNPVVNLTYAGGVGTRTVSTTGMTEANAITVNVTAGTDIVTTSASNVFKSLNFTGFAGVFSNTSRIVYGDLTISSGMTLTAGTNATTFAATSGVQSITSQGKTLDFPITINGVGGAVELQGPLTIGATRTFTLSNGTLNLNDNTLTIGLYSSNTTNPRTIIFGAGKIAIAGSNASVFTSNGFNTTVSGTKRVEFIYAGAVGTRNIGLMGGPTESNVFSFYILSGSDIVTVTGGARGACDLNFTGFSGTFTVATAVAIPIYGNLTFSPSMTISPSTVGFIFSGTSGAQEITTAEKLLDLPLSFSSVGGIFVFLDALTQGATKAFTITAGTVRLKNGGTSTVGSFVANTASAKFLQSATLGLQATLSQASGTINVADLNIRDINAVGGASWNAYVDFENTDAGNNDGWNFSLSPPYLASELAPALRPFTQLRRF